MAISRVQELQDCFPQLGRGTVESVLGQVRQSIPAVRQKPTSAC
jgi:hypothetical protein